MGDSDAEKKDFSALRNRALEILHKRPEDLASLPSYDVENLAHELGVYQIELEMQNEQLRDAQTELEHSRQEYFDLYDFAPVGYLTFTIKGIIQRANLTAASMLELERGYLVNQPFSKFIMHEDMDAYYLHRLNILKTKEQQGCQLRIKQKDGSTYWVYTQGSPVIDKDGQVTQIRCTITNITEQKHAEADRIELLKMLEFKNRELKDIVYTASHDLRSPLVNIQGFSNELKTDCDHLLELIADEEGANKSGEIAPLISQSIPQSLGFITASATKMSRLLDGLLQVSRVGVAKLDSVSIDMNNAMGGIITAMAYTIKENGIDVTIDSLPGCIADMEMLDHLFTNLVGNAIKYLDPDRKGRIQISGKVEDGRSVYCVADNGIGISPEYQKKVFEIFQRLNPNDSIGGEGLGLTIVMRIVDRLGGRVWVESKLGQGSKFFVSLPTTI